MFFYLCLGTHGEESCTCPISLPPTGALITLAVGILGDLFRPRRACRVRRYATPKPAQRSTLPALPAGRALPVHGPSADGIPTAPMVRPYVLDELHVRRRRRATVAAYRRSVDRDRLGLAVLLDLSSLSKKHPRAAA